MDFRTMEASALIERRTALVDSLELEDADLNAIEEEVRAINEELERRNAEEAKKKEIRSAVANGAGVVTNEPDTEGEGKDMETKEFRSSLEYNRAFVEGWKNNDFTELRTLFSANIENGDVPIPTQLEDEIIGAWENNDIVNLVKKTYYKGNVKVGFELTATGAEVHVENTPYPQEQQLTIGVVELKADYIKKWITVSDVAVYNTTIDTLGYLYREIANRIVEKAVAVLIQKINEAPQESSKTQAAVAHLDAAQVQIDTIMQAVALLSSSARNLDIVMNRATKPVFTSLALNAKYAVDVWDGLSDRIHFSSELPAFNEAQAGENYVIIGDFGYGAQFNYPDGNDVKLLTDEYSLAEQDLIKVVGKQLVGIGVVAPKAFVTIGKPNG